MNPNAVGAALVALGIPVATVSTLQQLMTTEAGASVAVAGLSAQLPDILRDLAPSLSPETKAKLIGILQES